jgi:hypothetical protein
MPERDRDALLWRMIKAQGGRVTLDMSPPPEGFVVLIQPSRTSPRHRILIAEILDPTSAQRDPESARPQHRTLRIDRLHIVFALILVAVLSLILTTAALWIGLH